MRLFTESKRRKAPSFTSRRLVSVVGIPRMRHAIVRGVLHSSELDHGASTAMPPVSNSEGLVNDCLHHRVSQQTSMTPASSVINRHPRNHHRGIGGG